MKLYGFKNTRSYKCIWLINELGIDCDYEEVDLSQGKHLSVEFLKIHSFGKVPVLVDGSLSLHEASAICDYLADKFNDKKLIPEPRSVERAIYNKWSYFMANELECQLWSIEKNSWQYPEEKRSEMAIEMAKSDFTKAVKIINAELEDKEFLLGGHFSAADISLGYVLRWARGHGLLANFKKLEEYLNRLILRENYPRELFK